MKPIKMVLADYPPMKAPLALSRAVASLLATAEDRQTRRLSCLRRANPSITPRFMEAAAIAGAGLATLSMSVQARAGSSHGRSGTDESNDKPTEVKAMAEDNRISDEIVKAKIRRALLSGPDNITREATVVEKDTWSADNPTLRRKRNRNTYP
jgi:hypothetical protein